MEIYACFFSVFFDTKITKLGAKHVERSKVVGAGGKDQVDTARTSYGTFFVRSEQSADPVVVVRH
jgi:hypothetical protein